MAYDPNWIYVDGFAGGGGASTGIAQARGRDVDIAINHSPSAIAIHKANHPDAEHICQDIRAVWPQHATKLRRVAVAWFSPDCKEYSRAKGGPLKDRHIRALSDEIDNWLRETQPRVAFVENVIEYETAGPLDEQGREIKELRGVPFKRRIRGWKRLGYKIEWRRLKACDYGAPTSRLRLYIVMRCDGLPIVWPEPTHGHPDSAEVRSGKLLPWRTAAECIDWTIPCPSIFDRDRPLAEPTHRRLAHGVMRHVVEAAKRGKAFIVPVTHQGSVRVHDLAEPMRTVTGAHRGELALGQAQLAPFVTYGQQGGLNRAADQPCHTIAASAKDTNGIAVAHLEKFSENSRGRPAGEPLDTVMAGATRHAAVTAFLSSFNGSDKLGAAGSPELPLPTIRTSGGKGGGHRAIVAAHIEQANGGPRNTNSTGRAADRPLSTATATGSQQRIVETTLIEEGDLPPELMSKAVRVAAFLVKYYTAGGGQHQAVNVPLDTITTKARFAVVTVVIDAVTYVIVDIGLRMLKPRELARAQGFPDSYKLNPVVRKFLRGKWVDAELTIAEQVSAIGNSVCPPVARALVAANQPDLGEERMAA